VPDFIDDVTFILQRFDWLSLLDILLVTAIIFSILLLLRDTKAVLLLRGALITLILLGAFAGYEALPAFSWLVQTTLPALLVAIPVIFAPEIRRALESVGRAGNLIPFAGNGRGVPEMVEVVVRAVEFLAEHKHGALIVLERLDSLKDYVNTGVALNADMSEKILQQIFYPNTPLHDGAVIIADGRIAAASAVMPLAQGDIQGQSSRRQLGLRHRAAAGISEATDAVAVVVSEETGAISIATGGRLVRRLDTARLRNMLTGAFRPLEEKRGFDHFLSRLFNRKIDKEI
jgi:diadenylate cyclase